MDAIEIRFKLVCALVASCVGLLVVRAEALAEIQDSGVQIPISGQAHDVHERVLTGFGALGMSFIENRGQMDKRVVYFEKSLDHSTYFAADGVTFKLRNDAVDPGLTHALRLVPLHANKHPPITGEKSRQAKVNYFIGSNTDEWRVQVPSFETVVYSNIYDKVDMKFYGNNNQLEYDFIVKPGADPADIALALQGVDAVELTASGDLAVTMGQEQIFKKKPIIYQIIDNQRVMVSGSYKLLAQSQGQSEQYVLGFEVGSYDRTADLVIDPVIVYSTYLGGKRLDAGYSIVVDNQGYAYVAGRSQSDTTFDVAEETGESPGFPVTDNAFQQHHADVTKTVGDGIVIKFDIESTELVYSTFIGGDSDPDFDNYPPQSYQNRNVWNQSGLDEAMTVTVDDAGNAYVAGFTLSKNFPTTKGAFQRKFGGGNCGRGNLIPCADAFVAKLNPDGSKLLYSTYIGGKGQDRVSGIRVDQAGSVYISGSTASDDFPVTSRAYQKARGGSCTAPSNYYECSDAFVVKLNPSGTALVYSTFIGGSRDEQAFGLALDNQGNAYIVGDVKSDDFPTTKQAYKRNRGNGRSTAFVAKLNTAGSGLVYSSYIGGNDGEDTGAGIAVDPDGYAYITGSTSASDFPTTPGVFGPGRHQATDAFVMKLNRDGSALEYSTLLGGDDRRKGNAPPPGTYASDIVIDEKGNAFITGVTTAADFPEVDPVAQVDTVGQGVIVAKIDPRGKKLLFSSEYTSKGHITGTSIAIDDKGDIYITGSCDGLLSVVNPMMEEYGGGGDAFIAKISLRDQQLLSQLE